ncbi:MAG: hypothetical protein AAGC85_13225, partial [Bacteroidota bacterium]
MWALSSGASTLLSSDSIGQYHFLRMTADSFFVSTSEAVLISGSYLLEDDSLFFQFERVSMEATIDSLVYKVENDQPTIDFFYKGEKLASQTLSDIQSERRTLSCRVEKSGGGGYTLIHKEGTIELEERSYTKPSAFSFGDVLRGVLGTLAMIFFGWLMSENQANLSHCVHYDRISSAVGNDVDLFSLDFASE